MNTPFWGPDLVSLASTDPEIADVVPGELDRLRGGPRLIDFSAFHAVTAPLRS